MHAIMHNCCTGMPTLNWLWDDHFVAKHNDVQPTTLKSSTFNFFLFIKHMNLLICKNLSSKIINVYT